MQWPHAPKRHHSLQIRDNKKNEKLEFSFFHFLIGQWHSEELKNIYIFFLIMEIIINSKRSTIAKYNIELY